MNSWETPFYESMLGGDAHVVISCQEEQLAQELMELLERYGITWSGGEFPTDNNRWYHYKTKTCYRVYGYKLRYDCTNIYDSKDFAGYTKCTFYGSDTTDFEAANDEKLIEFLTEVGV